MTNDPALSKDLKDLAYSLRSQVSTPKCIDSIAKQVSLKPALITLQKALKHYKDAGYDIESSVVPIEPYTLHVLKRIQESGIGVYKARDFSRLLTQPEKDAIQQFIEMILEALSNYESKVQAALDKMRKSNLTVAELMAFSKSRQT